MNNYDNSCDLRHLTWCAQVAVGIAESDGKVGSALSRHIFLMNWLRSAQKRHAFPKSVAAEIAYLLKEGLGVRLENGIYGHSRFCNTDFDDKLACLNLSGV